MYVVEPGNSFYKVSANSYFINDLNTGKAAFNGIAPEAAYINWAIDNFKNPELNFVDIGAHIGSYSWSLAPYFKQTFSFECNPEVYNCLCANIFLKGLSSKIVTHQCGLSSQSREMDYHVRSIEGGGNGFTDLGEVREKDNLGIIPMKLKTLDVFGIENIGLIKIDTEGHEKDVLMGSLETLRNSGFPPIIFESWAEWRNDSEHYVPARQLRKDLFEYISSIGYKIIQLAGEDELFLAEHK